jgi:hypothetical protein
MRFCGTGCLTNTTQFLDTLSYVVYFIMFSSRIHCHAAIFGVVSLSFQFSTASRKRKAVTVHAGGDIRAADHPFTIYYIAKCIMPVIVTERTEQFSMN